MARAWAERRNLARAAWCFAGALVLFGATVLRILFDGRAELAASDVAWAAGDAFAATVHARAAARAYVPFAPHVPRAYRRLRSIAQDSEARGDAQAAFFAWRGLRAAAIASRSLVSSHDREREVADAAIARLSAAAGAPSTRSERSGKEAASGLAASLAAEVPPRGAWGALLVVGAALWVAAGLRLTSTAGGTGNHFEGAGLRAPLAMALVGLVIWWVALFMV
jgi:hypothetical protein